MKKYVLHVTAAAVALIVLLSSCVSGVNLTVPKTKAGVSTGIQVAVGPIQDLRKEDRVKKNPNVIGVVRGGYGNPFNVSPSKGTELVASLPKLLKEAASAAGLTVVDEASPGTPVLSFDVDQFWIDGMIHYSIRTNLVLVANAPDGSRTLFRQEIRSNKEVVLAMSMSDVERGFQAAMADLLKQTTEILSSDEFKRVIAH